MNPSEKNKLTKEQLLEKYIAGTISRDEMHVLNQYAIDDDFLFESLEGLSEFEDSSATALAELNDRLLEKTKRKRPIYLYWAGAAASLAIIVFSVTLLNKTANESLNQTMVMDQVELDKKQIDEEIELAEKDAVDQAENSPPAKEIAIESVSEVEPEVPLGNAEISEIQAENSVVSLRNEKPTVAKSQTLNDDKGDEGITLLDTESEPSLDLPRRSVPPPSVQAAPTPSVAGASKASAKRKKTEVRAQPKAEESISEVDFSGLVEQKELEESVSLTKISGTVKSEDGDPIFGSAIISSQSNKIATSDQDGKFEIEVTDWNTELTIRSLGYQEEKIQLQSANPIEIVLGEEELKTIEVVYFDQPTVSQLDTAELVDFESYANFNMQLSDEVLEKIATDFLVLEFDVDQKGRAGNISVIDSLGFGADEEAVRLIQAYGKWHEKTKVQKMKTRLKLLFKGKK